MSKLQDSMSDGIPQNYAFIFEVFSLAMNPPPRVTVHEPDRRLAFDNRQLAASGCFIGA